MLDVYWYRYDDEQYAPSLEDCVTIVRLGSLAVKLKKFLVVRTKVIE